MSGIAGIYYVDGRPVSNKIDQMVDVIAHRGPDRVDTWRDDSVGLGHCLLETTPEDQYESLPLLDESGEFVVTADARLDNREQLTKKLDIRHHNDRPTTDSELILEAYKRWGRDCPKKLLGAFAFAIWDKPRQRVFLGRDHFGIKPLFYHYSAGNGILFGSEIKSILSVLESKPDLSDPYIANHLLFPVKLRNHETIFENIYSLKPSTHLSLGQSLNKSEYYDITNIRSIKYDNKSEYIKKFRGILSESVKCRLRSQKDVSAHLSGGLDSSSIVSTALHLQRRGNLESKQKGIGKIFTSIHSDLPRCNDKGFVRSVLNKYKAHEYHSYVDMKGVGIFSEMDKIIRYLDSPQRGGHSRSLWKINQKAKKADSRVILSGFDGDTTVSHGSGYFYELRESGRWIKLIKEVFQFAESTGEPKLSTIKSWLQGPFFSSKVGKILLKAYRSTKDEASFSPEWTNRVNDCFEEKVHRHESEDSPPSSEFEKHFRGVTSPVFSRSLEFSDMYAAPHHVEPRYPLCDKRLIEFCLSLPPELKIRSGWSRYILRRAMEGILPESIQWRPWKTIPEDIVHHDLLTSERARVRSLTKDIHKSHVARYLDEDYLNFSFAQYLSNPDVPVDNLAKDDRDVLWSALALEFWLRTFA